MQTVDTDLAIQSETELARRSRSGVGGHLLALGVVVSSTPLFHEASFWVVGLGFALVSVNALRLFLCLKQAAFYPGRRMVWKYLFSGCVVVSAGAWGALSVLALKTHGIYGPPSMLLLLISAALAAGGTSSIALERRTAFLYLNLLCIPPVLYMLSLLEFHAAMLGCGILVYYFFIRAQMRLTHHDYWEMKVTQKELDTQRLNSQYAARLVTLGEMAGGIAHEINNPLSIIAASAQQLEILSEMGEVTPEQLRQCMSRIRSTVSRIAKVIHGLRQFARDGEADPFDPVNLKTLIEETLELCRSRFLHHDIQLEVFGLSDATEIHCRQVQLSQVILNLLNNAYDAVENEPVKTIRLEVEDKGLTVEIRVSDTGKGVPAAIREKIMQPFFTTKEIGKGTGLGLSISRGIVESHKGDLSLSAHFPPTTFIVTLPKAGPQEIPLETIKAAA